MLPDGSNPEGVDPSPPLNWNNKSDIKDVVLYGMHCSPPCCKLMAYLVKYDVEYKVVSGTSKPGSDYKKMPVLDVNGRQVNDTYIILKNLIPALTGCPINEDWETICSYQLPFSIEDCLSTSDAAKWMSSPYGFGVPNCLLNCCMAGVLLNNVIKPNIQKGLKAMPDKAKVWPLNELATKFRLELGMKMFHNGGEAPGQVDISFYATILPFHYKGCENATAMISQSDLQDWWDRMKKEIPDEKMFPP